MVSRWLKDRRVAVLDVGSTKVCCAIASDDDNDGFLVNGYGKYSCSGVKSGLVTDIASVENAVINAVDRAERGAKRSISSVMSSVSSSKLRSDIYSASLEVQGGVVTQQDVLKVLARARPDLRGEDLEIIHAIPIEYSVDENYGISDPVGMLAKKISVRLHIVCVPKIVLNNLSLAVSGCHIKIDGYFSAPYAAAIASLEEEDMYNGATVFVFGGGTTSMATFYKGALLYVGTFSIGSSHITSDLSYGLKSSYENAERLKVLHGCLSHTNNKGNDMVLVPLGSYDETLSLQQVSKADLVNIIRPRMEEILDELKNRFNSRPYLDALTRKIVITGGGCQLLGLKEMIAKKFGKPVSIGAIKKVKGSPLLDIKQDFSTTAGLMMFAKLKAIDADLEISDEPHTARKPVENIWQSIYNWLVKNL